MKREERERKRGQRKKQRCCQRSGDAGNKEESSYTTGESQSTISSLYLWRLAGHRRTELDAARSRSVGSSGPVGRSLRACSSADPFARSLLRRASRQYVVSRGTGTTVARQLPRFVFFARFLFFFYNTYF